MNYNMYPNKRADSIDPNYIYPQPYIDPLMYMNPYAMSNESMANYNTSMSGMEYPTYSNQYADNPTYTSYSNMNDDNYYTDDAYSMNNNIASTTNIPVMPPNMMFPGMFPPNMMPPGMMNQGMMIPPNMMFPGMMPYMNMMPNIPAVNMEEFDEEEM